MYTAQWYIVGTCHAGALRPAKFPKIPENNNYPFRTQCYYVFTKPILNRLFNPVLLKLIT